jgi:hypothetical protein
MAGTVGVEGSFAAAKRKDPGVCSLSQGPTGDLMASGSGFTGSSSFQYEIYSAPQMSVGGGELFTNASGGFTADLGSTSFFMGVYPNERTLTVDLYPIVGNKADMSVVAASCSTTP